MNALNHGLLLIKARTQLQNVRYVKWPTIATVLQCFRMMA